MRGLEGVRVALLEGRMSGELAGLVRRYGGEPYCVPAVREAALDCSAEVAELLDFLEGGKVVVFQTGVGAEALFLEAERLGRLDDLLAALGRGVVACRGPKPGAVLAKRRVRVDVKAEEPYTTANLLDALAGAGVADADVAVLQYGERNAALSDALGALGARVRELCLYEWLLPEDAGPLRALVGEIVAGQVPAAAFTHRRRRGMRGRPGPRARDRDGRGVGRAHVQRGVAESRGRAACRARAPQDGADDCGVG
jgi:uroporphyrinogen-III synthase